jgi:hypothetical protein
MGDWANDYFNLLDGNTIDINRDIAKVYSLNGGNYCKLPPELDLSLVYLHWDLSDIAYDYVCEMMIDIEANYIKEYLVIQ